jgi:hypothetical protein
MKDCDSKKECLGCDCRKKTLVALAVFLALVLASAWILIGQAQTGQDKWKNFKEKTYGFSMDYPANWALDVNYDRYAPGIISAELNNRKCAKSGQCDLDCVDLRVLAARKPVDGQGSGLLVQLYEDFMMVRDFSISPLVSEIELASKKIFQVENGDPTLALNGACAGPLYVFETKDYFAYVFAGYGANAASADEQTREIINSIAVGASETE